MHILILYLLFGSIFVYSNLIRVFELPHFRSNDNQTFDSMFSAVYFSVITLTTIGYGDISPNSKPGQMLTIMYALWGTLLLSFFVVAVSDSFKLNDQQEIAQTYVQAHKEAGRCILQGFRLFRVKKKLHLLK